MLPENGSLMIQNMGWGDRGKYRCLAWNNIQQISHLFQPKNIANSQILEKDASSKKGSVQLSSVGSFTKSDTKSEAQAYEEATVKLKIDTTYRQTLYRLSLVYGFSTAGGFLLITLLAKLIFFLLHK